MKPKILCIINVLLHVNLLQCYAARILVFMATASVSHQNANKDLSLELVRRGHEVVRITPNPIFINGNTPVNFTEIDVSEAGYKAKNASMAKEALSNNAASHLRLIAYFSYIFTDMFIEEVNTEQVRAIINDKNKKFDLLILEACTKVSLVLSHIFDAPVILYSSFGTLEMYTDYVGAAAHAVLYPTVTHQKLYNLSIYQKIVEIYRHYEFENTIRNIETEEDKILETHFGPDVPPLKELKKNIAMVFIAEHQVWDNNRPVPPNMVYVGGIYPQKQTVSLPREIETYLNESVNGVVYVSLGTTVYASLLPNETMKTIVRAFSQLPYDVLMKWNNDDFIGISNVKIFRWVPQFEVLRHPKVKLFITQGGMQSTDDAIAAGVPLIGMPMLVDQWYNVEQYVRFNVGLRVDIESVTEEKLLNAIHTVINDESYRRNMVNLRDVMSDQPQTALDRAVFWSEYVIRHKGAPLLRSATALISNWDYYQLDLIIAAFCAVIIIVLLISLISFQFTFFRRVCNKMKTD